MPKKAKIEGFSHIAGVVVHGDGRGQLLGFPTANLVLDDPSRRPQDGIYAGWAQRLGNKVWYQAAIHIGPRPTYPGAAATIEVHLLEYIGRPLYGERLHVQCSDYIRPIRTFKNTAALQHAIAADIRAVQSLLAKKENSSAS